MATPTYVDGASPRAAGHLERTVLAPQGLTWTGWVVLWVLGVWGEAESKQVAAEAGVAKATLTGVQQTLVGNGLIARRVHADDARRVLLSLTEESPRSSGSRSPRGLRTLVRRAELR